MLTESVTDAQIKQFVNTPARSCLIQQGHVYLPFLYFDKSQEQSPKTPKFIRVHRKHTAFLYHYGQDGMSFEEAATKAGLTVEQAGRFWRRKDVQEWLSNMAAEISVQVDWQRRPAKWWALGDKWMKAPKEEKPTKMDVEIWKEFGDRVMPKPSRGNDGSSHGKIEIHIDGEVLKYFKGRQEAIEAEVVGG